MHPGRDEDRPILQRALEVSGNDHLLQRKPRDRPAKLRPLVVDVALVIFNHDFFLEPVGS